MIPLLPLIGAGLGVVSGGVGVAGAMYANKQTGNTPRIKELKQAQATGQLSRTGQLTATIGQEQAKIAQDEAIRRAAAQQGALGFASSADMAALDAARVGAERAAAAESAQAIGREFAAEGQELEDRKQLRYARQMEQVNFGTQGMSSAGEAFGAGAGYTAKATPAKLDTSAATKEEQDAWAEYGDVYDDTADYTAIEDYASMGF